MAHPRYSSDEITTRGEQIYETQLKNQLEPEHIGQFLVIDIETGEYDIDKDDVTVSLRASRKKPDGARFIMQVGCDTSGTLW